MAHGILCCDGPCMKHPNSQTYQKGQDLGTVDQAQTKTSCPSGGCSHKSGHIQRLIEIDELSAMLGVAKNTLYDWCAVRKIPHIKLGKLLRFDAAEIEAWWKTKRVAVKNV